MKTLQSPKVTVSADGKTATVVFQIVEKQFGNFPSQRVTIGHLNPSNKKHPRHVQATDEGVFVKNMMNGEGVAIELDDFVQMAAVINPATTFAPRFKKSDAPLTVEISSELDPDFQWQVTDSIEIKSVTAESGLTPIQPIWTDIAGQVTKTLDKASVKSGQWIRCKAYSQAGEMFSNPVKI